MDIVYSSSDAYSECTGISLFTLYSCNQSVDDLNVNILSTDISSQNKKKLIEVSQIFGRNLNIIDAKQDFVDEAERLNLKLLRGAYNTYSRVVLNRWFGHLDKIMVIDSDTMICGSIEGAWKQNIDSYLLAAVPEIAVYNPFSDNEDMNLVDRSDLYYNMGICVVNLKKWREDDVDSLIAKSIERDKPYFKIADQSIINMYCVGKIARLPLKYNYYSPVHNVDYKTINDVFSKRVIFKESEFNEASSNPLIIHYFGHSYERPWFKHSVAFRKKDYLIEKAKTPWAYEKEGKWRKSGSIIMNIYDQVCYLLLLLRQYKTCLKFRYIWGQRIKSNTKLSR